MFSLWFFDLLLLLTLTVSLSIETQSHIGFAADCQELFARPIIAWVSGVWAGQKSDPDVIWSRYFTERLAHQNWRTTDVRGDVAQNRSFRVRPGTVRRSA